MSDHSAIRRILPAALVALPVLLSGCSHDPANQNEGTTGTIDTGRGAIDATTAPAGTNLGTGDTVPGPDESRDDKFPGTEPLPKPEP